MRPRTRSLGAVATLAAAALLAGCGGDSTEAAATTDTVATTVPEAVTMTTGTNTAPATTTTAGPTTITIVVENAAPAGGIKRATVAKGDNVVLVVHSDVADEIHLHGYNLSTDVRCRGRRAHPLRGHGSGPVRGRARAARRADRRPHRHAVGAAEYSTYQGVGFVGKAY